MAWRASACYEDGFEINGRIFSSSARNHKEECVEEQNIEEYLIEAHDGCVWYSVAWIDEE